MLITADSFMSQSPCFPRTKHKLLVYGLSFLITYILLGIWSHLCLLWLQKLPTSFYDKIFDWGIKGRIYLCITNSGSWRWIFWKSIL